MGNIAVGKDVGGIWREVDDWPPGTGDDGGITGVTINGKKNVRNKKGVHNSDEIGLFANGQDQTARFNTVVAHAKLKIIELHVDGGGTIIINGTVTVPAGKTLKFVDGTMLGGSGTISGFRLKADDTSQLIDSTATLTFQPASFSGKHISAAWWGFKPNTGTDQTALLQKAINCGIYSDSTKKVIIPLIGYYFISNLVIARFNGLEYSQCTVSLEGVMNSTSQGVTFHNPNINSATILIQQAQGIDIDNIVFEGLGPDVPDFVIATDSDWIIAKNNAGTIRNNRKSPYCAVAIDPFFAVGAFNSQIFSTADMYPGMEGYYSNFVYGGSTNVTMTNCVFSRMYVGVAEGLSGQANGEGIHIEGGFGIFVAHMWAAGQLQSRENTIEHFYFIFGHTFVSGVTAGVAWGTGLGDIPSVTNCNINYLKYMFDVTGNFSLPRFNIGYSEGIWSLGISSGSVPITFNNWNLSLVTNGYTGTYRGRAVVLAQTGGPLTFSNCQIQSSNYYSPLPFATALTTFINCRLESGIVLSVDTTRYNDNVKFINCVWYWFGQVRRLDDMRRNTVTDANVFYNRNESYLSPGSSIKGQDDREHTHVGDRYDFYPLKIDQYNSGYALTIDAATQTATFTSDEPGLLAVNDVIVTGTYRTLAKDEDGNEVIPRTPVDWPGDNYAVSNAAAVGIVTAITGSVITLGDITAGLINGEIYQLFLARMPRMVPRTLGTITDGSTNITNVLQEGGGFEAGNRINGYGIVPGTVVLQNWGGTIILSRPATASATLVALYDARIRVTADDVTFYYVGGNYNYDNLPAIWFIGDELRNAYGSRSRGRYCIANGYTTSPTPPTWYSDSDDHNVAETDPVFTAASPNIPRLDAPNNFQQPQFAPRIITPLNQGDSTVVAGAIEMQSYSVDDCWIGANIYFSAGFRFRAAGPGVLIRLIAGSIYIQSAGAPGAAGAPATLTDIIQLGAGGQVNIPNGPLSIPGYDANNSKLRVGTLEFQPAAAGSNIIGSNIYYDSVNGFFKYRVANTPGSCIQFTNTGDIAFSTFRGGGGANGFAMGDIRLIIGHDGKVELPASITDGGFPYSRLKIGSIEFVTPAHNSSYITDNLYTEDGGNWKLRAAGMGTILDIGNGQFILSIVPDGAADEVVTPQVVIYVEPDGSVSIPILGGAGDRYAGIDSTGKLIAMPTPGDGGGVDDPNNAKINIPNTFQELQTLVNGMISLGRIYLDHVFGSGASIFFRAGNSPDGTPTFQFGANTTGSFGGTPDTPDGRVLYFYDQVLGLYRLAFNAAGDMYIGAGLAEYDLRILKGVSMDSPLPLNITGVSETNSKLKVGSFEFQPRANNASSFGENIYWDGTTFRLRAAGVSTLFYYGAYAFGIYTTPAGLAGDAVSPSMRLRIDMATGGIELPGFLPNDSKLRIGALEFRAGSVNSSNIQENLWYDGTNWRYRANGVGLMLVFAGTGISMYTAPLGAAGDIATITQQHLFDLSGALNILGTSTTDSKLRVGSFEIQPKGVNGSFFGENVYYDGAAYRLRADGAASMLYFGGGAMGIYTTPYGLAGAAVTLHSRLGINMDSGKNTVNGFLATDSKFVVGDDGGLEIQPLAIDNSYIFSNLYWDGTNYRYRAAGAGSFLHFTGGGVAFANAPVGAAGAIATLTPRYAIVNGQMVIDSLILGQLKGSGGMPTIVASTGAGTSPTVGIAQGHSLCFRANIIAGTAPGAAGTLIATVTLPQAVGGANPMTSYAARSADAAACPFYFNTTSSSVLIYAAAALVAGKSYSMDITVIDY